MVDKLDEKQKNIELSPEAQILELKKKVAEKYFKNLMEKKSGLVPILMGEGKRVKNFLVSEGLGDIIWDGLRWTLMKNVFAWIDPKIFDELEAMKEIINGPEAELNKLAEELGILKGDDVWTPADKEESDPIPVAEAVASAAVVAPVVWASVVESPNDIENSKAGSVDKCFCVLSGGSTNVKLRNREARRSIEGLLAPCTFFGKKLTLNKYIIPRLEMVEKQLKSAGVHYPIKDIWGYNWRNMSWWSSLSYHALWLALDINPKKNPFVMTKRPEIPSDMPKEFVDIFKKNWFVWWGDRWNTDRDKWSSYKSDAMHFQFSDERYLKEQMQEPTYKMAA